MSPEITNASALLELRPGRFLHIQRHTGTDDTAIFLVHGLGGHARQWRHIWPELEHHTAATLIAADLPGHGASPQLDARRDYAGGKLIDDLLALLRRYGKARNLFVVHSFGARLVLAMLQSLARHHELQRVDGAVLLGSPAVEAKLAGGIFKYLPVFILERLRHRLDRSFRRLAWHAATDPALIDEERRLTGHNSLHVLKSVLTQAPPLEVAALPALQLPILLLTGHDDLLTPPAAARHLQTLLPQSKLELISTASHQLMLEQPQAVSTQLLQFIHSLKTTTV